MGFSEIVSKNESELIYKDCEIKNIDASNFFSNQEFVSFKVVVDDSGNHKKQFLIIFKIK